MVFDGDHDFEGPRDPKARLDTVNTNLLHHLGRPRSQRIAERARSWTRRKASRRDAIVLDVVQQMDVRAKRLPWL